MKAFKVKDKKNEITIMINTRFISYTIMKSLEL